MDESITLVQFAYEELAAAEKVDQMILVDGYSLGYITVVDISLNINRSFTY